MPKASEKVIAVRSDQAADGEPCIGQRLRELRTLAGLTQIELATRLGIGQAVLSRLEKRSDVQVSTLKDYVEALGATLRIDAAFDSATTLRIIDVFEEGQLDDNQFVLPILPEADFKHRRDVVLSIKPQYSSLIMEGRKTVELRRRFPTKIPRGTLAFIYSTTPDQALVGTARIRRIIKKPIGTIWTEYSQTACIDKFAFDNYFMGLKEGYVLQFENARSLRRPVGLQELRQRFNFEPPQSFLYAKPFLREALVYERSEIPH
jgi:predicted transcriptional regulator/DNA-binding XRE family transcriptional regulator